MREHDNLPLFRFLNQAFRHAVTPFKIQRRNRIVKHDGGRIIHRLLIAKTKDAIALARQPFIPQGVVTLGFGEIVPAAV